jgi:hypothetical protein
MNPKARQQQFEAIKQDPTRIGRILITFPQNIRLTKKQIQYLQDLLVDIVAEHKLETGVEFSSFVAGFVKLNEVTDDDDRCFVINFRVVPNGSLQ